MADACMRYRLTPALNDGKADAPPLVVDVDDVIDLLTPVLRELTNDESQPFGAGFTLMIERIG
jgi:hypothetical protein